MPQAAQVQFFVALLDEYIGYLEDVPATDKSEGHFQLEDRINKAAEPVGFAPLFDRKEEWHDARELQAGGVEELVNAIYAAVDDGKMHPAEAEPKLREIEKNYHIALKLTVQFPIERGLMWFPALPLDSGERKQLVTILRQWQRAARTRSVDQVTAGSQTVDPPKATEAAHIPTSGDADAKSADVGGHFTPAELATKYGIAIQLRDLRTRYDADKRPIEAFSISGVMPAGPTEVGAFAVSTVDKHGKKVGQEYVRYKRLSLSELAELKHSVGVAGVGVLEERAYPDHELHRIADGEKLIEYIQEAGKLLLAAVNSGGFTLHPELRDLIQKTGAAVQGKRDAEFAFGRLGAIYANATEFWLFKQRPELRPYAMIENRIVAPDNQTTNVISFHGSCAAFADLLEAESGAKVFPDPPAAQDGRGEPSGAINISKPARIAGQQYAQAVGKADKTMTDDEAYAYVKEHIAESPDEMPDEENWKRQLRAFRKATGTQKNKPRGGRVNSARSVVGLNQESFATG